VRIGVISLTLFCIGLVACQSQLLPNDRDAAKNNTSSTQKQCYLDQKIPSMGTFLELQLVSTCGSAQLPNAILAIKNRLDSLEAELSLYQKDSALSRLNKFGQVDKVSSDFLTILRLSLEHNLNTDGAFNIGVEPILEEIRNSLKNGNQPKNLSGFRNLLDLKQVLIQQNRVSFKTKGMKLTFDGVAKGYAVDEIASLLEQRGIENYLVNFSGNMRWRGHREDAQNWKIAIWDPVSSLAIQIANRQRGAIASSGIDYNHYSTDKKWHHIIDPRTLRPANENTAATVIGTSATICDILSTTTFILNEKDRQKIYLDRYSEYGYWVRSKEDHIFTFRIE